jgi:hypothetical protein
MLKIEVVEEIISGTIDDFELGHRLKINSIYDGKSIYRDNNKIKFGYLSKFEVIETISNYSFEEVSRYLHEFRYSQELEIWDFGVVISVICKSFDNFTAPKIKISLSFGWEKWDKPILI